MKIVELSYPLSSGMLKYPSDPEARIKINPSREEIKYVEILDASGFGSGAACGETKYKSGYGELGIRNHHGTHVDAPFHKLKDGKRITDYPDEKFINTARLVDLTLTNLLQRERREITTLDIEACVDHYDFRNLEEFTKGLSALVFYTGYCNELLKHNGGREIEKRFPYFSEAAAKYIVGHAGNLNLIGIDSFSIDPSGSNSEAHRAFFAKEILVLETLYNLKELRDKRAYGPFKLISVPIKILGGDAAPTAAYAEL